MKKKVLVLLGLAAIAALFFRNGKKRKLQGSDEDLMLDWGQMPGGFTIRPSRGGR